MSISNYLDFDDKTFILDGEDLSTDYTELKARVDVVEADVDQNKLDISSNEGNITTNATNISTVTNRIDAGPRLSLDSTYTTVRKSASLSTFPTAGVYTFVDIGDLDFSGRMDPSTPYKCKFTPEICFAMSNNQQNGYYTVKYKAILRLTHLDGSNPTTVPLSSENTFAHFHGHFDIKTNLFSPAEFMFNRGATDIWKVQVGIDWIYPDTNPGSPDLPFTYGGSIFSGAMLTHFFGVFNNSVFQVNYSAIP